MSTNTPYDDELVSARRIGSHFGVSARTVVNWAASGFIPSPTRLGPRTLRWRFGDVRKRIIAASPDGRELLSQPLPELVDAIRRLEVTESETCREIEANEAARQNLAGLLDDARVVLDKIERYAEWIEGRDRG